MEDEGEVLEVEREVQKGGPRNVENLVRWPGVWLLIVGVADLVSTVFSMIGGEAIVPAIIEAVQKENPDFDPDVLGGMGWYSPSHLLLIGFGLAITLLVIVGGLRMMSMKGWWLGLTAAILAMIPCFGPCCGIGLPIGLWALFVLMKPDVKQAFT